MRDRTAARGEAAFSLANLGVIDERRVRFDELAPRLVSTFGPAIWGGGVDVCASTYRDSLTLSIGFCSEDQEPAVVEGILDTMVRELVTCGAEACASAR